MAGTLAQEHYVSGKDICNWLSGRDIFGRI